MPPLLLKLSEKRPDRLHYIGVSYGLTPALHKFWKRADFVPLYLRQTPNDLTGEHTCVMLKALKSDDLVTSCDPNWLSAFARDFHRRILNLLSYQFSVYPTVLALSIMEATKKVIRDSDRSRGMYPLSTLFSVYSYSFLLSLIGVSLIVLTKNDLDNLFSSYDLKRLDRYAKNLLDYHVIVDLVPNIAFLYFEGRFGESVKLSGIQSSLLAGIGLQKKTIDKLEVR